MCIKFEISNIVDLLQNYFFNYKMETQKPSETQPIIADQFIVKVKLLSNQVYEFTIDPETTKVSELKQKILEKINVPIERQRIVFGGKQLVDQNKVTDYVKESGLTVHLIAKIGGPQTTTTNTNTNPSSTQNTQQGASNSQQNQPQPNTQPNTNNQPSNPFGNVMYMMGSGIGVPQAATMTFSNMGGLNQGLGNLGSLGGLLGSLGYIIPQQLNQQGSPQGATQNRGTTSQPPNTVNTNSNPFLTPPTNRASSQQNNQPTSVFTTNVPRQQHPQPPSVSSNTWSVSNEPILQLNQTISTLNLPTQPVLDNRHLSLREQTAQYLRRLQHQYMRMIPQLNRSIQLLNEGRVTHLSEVLRLFESIDSANLHAQQAIRRLINLPVNQQQTTNQQTSTAQQFGNSSQMLDQGNLFGNNVTTNVEATIIIQEDQILDADIDEQPTIFSTQNNQATSNEPRIINSGTTTITLGPNNLGGLSNLFGNLTGQQQPQGQPQNQFPNSTQPPMMGGFNLGGLMSMLGGSGLNMGVNMQNNHPNQQPNMNNNSASSNPQQNTQQPTNGQAPQLDLGNLASMASMLFNPQASTTSGQQSNPQSLSNPLGGGIMGIFNSLQQSGGMGQLMSMSLGQMLEQGANQPTVYSAIFKSFTGGDLLNCFTSKNFDFLDRKYVQIRQNFLRAISIAGSQSDLVQIITQDVTRLLTPRDCMKNEALCITQTREIIKKYIEQICRLTMSKGDAKYSQKAIQSLKKAFCEAVEKISSQIDTSKLINGQTAQQLVFANLKSNSISLMDQFIQGLSGMFYGFIEKDFIRVYTQYKEEQKRKNKRNNDQVASEEELLKQIEAESKNDIEYLKNFKHSGYYHPKPE